MQNMRGFKSFIKKVKMIKTEATFNTINKSSLLLGFAEVQNVKIYSPILHKCAANSRLL